MNDEPIAVIKNWTTHFVLKTDQYGRVFGFLRIGDPPFGFRHTDTWLTDDMVMKDACRTIRLIVGNMVDLVESSK